MVIRLNTVLRLLAEEIRRSGVSAITFALMVSRNKDAGSMEDAALIADADLMKILTDRL